MQSVAADATLRGLLQQVSAAEYAYIAGACLSFPAARLVLDALIFKHVARLVIVPSSLRKARSLPGKLEARVTKMCESLWKLTAYASFIALEVVALRGQQWTRQAKWDYWGGWPNQEVTLLTKAFFGAQLGYYISTIYTLAFWEVPRKDYYVMQFHHCCTAALILVSYAHRYFRCASVVMLLHDTNDVIMELAKTFSYAQLHALSNAVLGLFVVAWAVLRIYCFPRFILYSTYVEVERTLGFKPPFYWFMNIGLSLLYCLHVYWFSLILRVAYIALTTGKPKDVREEDDNFD